VSGSVQQNFNLQATVKYANDHWACKEATCYTKVPHPGAPTAADEPTEWQTDYQCAEFVARSLAAGGFMGGLTSGAPQTLYENWHGHYNLLVTDDLMNYLKTMGFTDAGTSSAAVKAGCVVEGDAYDGEYDGHVCIGVGPGLIDCHNNPHQQAAVDDIFEYVHAVFCPPKSALSAKSRSTSRSGSSRGSRKGSSSRRK